MTEQRQKSRFSARAAAILAPLAIMQAARAQSGIAQPSASQKYSVEIGIQNSTSRADEVIPVSFSNIQDALRITPMVSFRLLAELGVTPKVDSTVRNAAGQVVGRDICDPVTSTGAGTIVYCREAIGAAAPVSKQIRLTAPLPP